MQVPLALRAKCLGDLFLGWNCKNCGCKNCGPASSPLREKAGVGSFLLMACHCAGVGVDGKNVSSSSYYYRTKVDAPDASKGQKSKRQG